MIPLLLHVQVGGPRWLQWSLHPDALLLCIVLGYGYYYCVTELRPKVSDAGRVRRSQAILFYLGVITLYAAGGSPLHDLGERYLLSAHMLEHLLFGMVAAPLLVAGTPAWLWEALLCGPKVYPISRVLTKPFVAFSIFNALLVLTHLPATMDLALRVGAFHFLIHAVLILSAMLMWWPILSPLRQLPRPAPPLQMAYLFLQSILPAVIASFITFADHAVYPFYAQAPRLWHISPVADQQIAGGTMKLMGSLILWSFMTVIFFRWYTKEETEAQEPRWKDVEAELDELGIRHQV
jgi:putative membrane protein